MKKFELQKIKQLLDDKYARGEVTFRNGDVRSVVREFYAEDAYYLTPRLKLLKGRREIGDFFEQIKTEIGEVKVFPVCLWGDPSGVVFQFCNTVRRGPRGGDVSHAHYIAAFRQAGEDWLCEMEVVALGHIDENTALNRAGAASSAHRAPEK